MSGCAQDVCFNISSRRERRGFPSGCASPEEFPLPGVADAISPRADALCSHIAEWCFSARTSAWSRCPHSMQQKIAWHSRVTGINDTARRAGLRGVAGHHHAVPINTGGFKAGWQCRQAARWRRIAYDRGCLARLPSATLKLKSSMAVSS
jgi:hypothetical protein